MTETLLTLKISNRFNDFIDESLMLYTFLSFLKSYKKLNSYITEPLEIVKSESPDFILKSEIITIGVEICTGVPQNLKYASALSKDYPEGSLIELDQNILNKENLKKNEVKEFIKTPDEKLNGPPWYGGSIEHSWAKNVCKMIEKKIEKLNDCYSLFNMNILLINSDFLLNRDYEISEKFLLAEVKKKNFKGKFKITYDEIYTISKVKNAVLFQL